MNAMHKGAGLLNGASIEKSRTIVRTRNRFAFRFLLASGALLLNTDFAFAAGDAQEQARSVLTGVAGDHVSFPVSVSDAHQVDPQTHAQWLLAGKPQGSSAATPTQLQNTGVVDASNLARRLLTGNGS